MAMSVGPLTMRTTFTVIEVNGSVRVVGSPALIAWAAANNPSEGLHHIPGGGKRCGCCAGRRAAEIRNLAVTMIDTLKGVALIGTFIGVLITFAMWVSLWENVWRVSVEPVRGAISTVNSIALALRLAFAHLDVVADGGVPPDIRRGRIGSEGCAP
jgi:hypothetical protein